MILVLGEQTSGIISKSLRTVKLNLEIQDGEDGGLLGPQLGQENKKI